MKHFTLLLILTVLLSGCMHKTATSHIVDEHVQLVDCALVDLGKNPDIDKAKEALREANLQIEEWKLKERARKEGKDVDDL